MERIQAWKKYCSEELAEVNNFASDYIDFISNNKTERECCATSVEEAKKLGYQALSDILREKKSLKAGDKVWATSKNKAVMLVHIGTEDIENGMNILGAHIDSPRLDIKQNPFFEKCDFTLMDTHYYGGIKKYQWVAMPLAIHGVVAKKDGEVVNICIGEDPSDPVFCVSDLLPHLGAEQLKKEASKVIEGEALDLIVGNMPSNEGKNDDEKETIKKYTLSLIKDKYGIDEEDFLSAELEVVPAGRARELGFDRSMILGYGQDDKVCAYTSLIAQLELAKQNITPKKTCITILVDKEEIGSVGASSMESAFFENVVMEICELLGKKSAVSVKRALAASKMLSSDVNAGVDPSYMEAFEEKNASFCGKGLVFSKFTGARGKSGSNDANAEYIGEIRRIMDDNNVTYQFAELGKVDVGGGGTIAFIPANMGMEVIDSGVAVLSMHAPWEVTSKCDVYEAYRGYLAFLQCA